MWGDVPAIKKSWDIPVFFIFRPADISIYVEKQWNNSPSRSNQRRAILSVLVLCTLAITMSDMEVNRSATRIQPTPMARPLNAHYWKNNESGRDMRECDRCGYFFR